MKILFNKNLSNLIQNFSYLDKVSGKNLLSLNKIEQLFIK